MRYKPFIGNSVFFLIVLVAACSPAERPPEPADSALTVAEAREIARDAYIYGNPLVDSYRILHTYFVDTENPEYKAPWNEIYSLARVFTHEDRAVQAANSDTPYSFVGIDLRAEPIVLGVPAMDESRYFSVQLIDLYTHIIDYIGSRTTGNHGGHYLLTGPRWEGKVPKGIDKVIHVETELAFGIYRTQLFDPDDLANVVEVQQGYTLQTLSEFLEIEAPEPAPAIEFIEPLTAADIRSSLDVFEQINFVLQFCPAHESEIELFERFSRIGVGSDADFAATSFPPEITAALSQGIGDAWQEFDKLKEKADRGEIESGEVFGSRAFLQNNYLYRFGAAVMGIWGNSEAEAIYPTYYVDADGQALSGANNYAVRFKPGELPPVHAFWSLTMYGLPGSLLVENPIDRYLLNSTMIDDFVRDEDGGITLYIQHDPPVDELLLNWLPAPKGPFHANLRLYWPKESALDGSWPPPPLVRSE